jgi:hypothetical protein
VNFLIDTLATIRLTRLVIDDTITEPLRDRAMDALIRTGEEHPELQPITEKLEYLLSCPWCVSVYAAAALLVLRKLAPETAALVNGALAASLVTGMVYSRTTDSEPTGRVEESPRRKEHHLEELYRTDRRSPP